MNKKTALDEIDNLISEGEKIISNTFHKNCNDILPYESYNVWIHKVLYFLKQFLNSKDDFFAEIEKRKTNTLQHGGYVVATLKNVRTYIDKGIISFSSPKVTECDSSLELIFERFHRVAIQLRERRDKRPALEMNDEYDVQYLLHALLKLQFDDIRPEVWTPHYAGKSSRVDFFVDEIKTVIEVKRTRAGLADGELGDQLIIDVDRYKVYKDCEQLICFVYDPEFRIKNPTGLMNDLNEKHKGFVKVIIKPKP